VAKNCQNNKILFLLFFGCKKLELFILVKNPLKITLFLVASLLLKISYFRRQLLKISLIHGKNCLADKIHQK
jgi:hypothetical protein